jgi:DNA topoisomerase-1
MAAQDKGLFIGDSHKDGGIPSEVKQTGQQIEIEGDEYYICSEAYNSSKEYSFKGKTNKQILDNIYTENSCKLNQSVMSAGDFIICKVVVKDTSKKDREGTIKQIVNEMQGEKSCKVENKNSSFKSGGAVKTRTIKRKDGTEYEVKVYSEEELKARSEKKKDSLKNIAQNISKLRSVVNEDLKSENEKDFLTALAVYIMLETSERVGNGTSAQNGHYGVTGLKRSHIKISGSTVKFDYTGKSGVEHDKDVTNQKLAELLNKAIKNSSTDEIFVTSDGFKIKNDKVNRYLKKLNVSAKDIRGYSANKWIISKLNRLTPEETDTKRKRQFNEVCKEVAAKVGHGAATLKKHYLLPEIQINWIEKGKVIDLANFKPEEMKFGGAVKTEKEKAKIAKVMGEFKDEKLKTSHGKKVTNRKQAVAIALSEADRMAKGGGVFQNYLKGKKTKLWNIFKDHYITDKHEAEEDNQNYSQLNIWREGDLNDLVNPKPFDKEMYYDFNGFENQISKIIKDKSVDKIELEYGDYEGETTEWLTLFERKRNGGSVEAGTKVEMEHKKTIKKLSTGKYSTKKGAEMIAKDHLKESNKYYEELEKMEKELEKKEKSGSIKSNWFSGELSFLNW